MNSILCKQQAKVLSNNCCINNFCKTYLQEGVTLSFFIVEWLQADSDELLKANAKLITMNTVQYYNNKINYVHRQWVRSLYLE